MYTERGCKELGLGFRFIGCFLLLCVQLSPVSINKNFTLDVIRMLPHAGLSDILLVSLSVYGNQNQNTKTLFYFIQ